MSFSNLDIDILGCPLSLVMLESAGHAKLATSQKKKLADGRIVVVRGPPFSLMMSAPLSISFPLPVSLMMRGSVMVPLRK